MAITVHDCEQGTPAWHKARAGIPTSSCFHEVTKRNRDGAYSTDRRRYLLTLLGERYTGEVAETFGGGYLARGKAMEDEARRLYVFQTDHHVTRVGFVVNSAWRAGASPDSLIGKNGGLEIKTKLPHLHFECLETNQVPDEHMPQIQGALGITGRSWWDFVSYWPKCPIFIKRVRRDEHYIASLKLEVRRFNDELDALVRKYTKRAA